MMRGFIPVNDASGNPVLEILTRTSLGITIVYYSLVSAAFVYLGYTHTSLSVFRSSILVIGGLVTWTLLEYLINCAIYWISNRIPTMSGFRNAVHGIQQGKFRDKDSALMPPVPGLVISLTAFGANFSLMGWPAAYFTSGLALGYVLFAWVHYNIHVRPPHPLLRFLWRHHTLHHFKYPDKAFGVTSPFWDIVFRTMPPKSVKKVEQKHVHLN